MKIRGFTLIELLVVIAVLGVLAGGVFVAINPLKRINQANDAKIKSDIGQIANAMQAYYVTNQKYPTNLQALKDSGDLKTIPTGAYEITDTNGNPCADPCTNVIVSTPLDVPQTPGGNYTWNSETGQVGEVAPTPTLTPVPTATLTPTPHPLAVGLVGYWKFNEGSGATTTDATGNGTSANLVNGPTWENSINASFGKALRLDGINDYVLAPQNTALNNAAAGPFTASLWINPTSLSSYPGLLNKGWDWLINGGQGCFRWPNCDYLWFYVPANVWTNVVLTYNPTVSSNNLKVYTQGSERSSTTRPQSSGINTSPLNIGGAGNGKFPGKIDEVRIYNRALSPTEVNNLYNYTPTL